MNQFIPRQSFLNRYFYQFLYVKFSKFAIFNSKNFDFSLPILQYFQTVHLSKPLLNTRYVFIKI